MEHAATRASSSDECGRPLRLTQERVLVLTPCLFYRGWRRFHQVLRLNKNALYLRVLFADGILQMLDGLGHLGRAQVIGKVYVEGYNHVVWADEPVKYAAMNLLTAMATLAAMPP